MLKDQRFAIKAKLFRGLADLSRLRILESLRSGRKCVSELVTWTGLSQPNVSAHLSCLAQCGLVIGTPEGRKVYYQLARNDIEALLALSDLVLDETRSGISACPNYESIETETSISSQAALTARSGREEAHV